MSLWGLFLFIDGWHVKALVPMYTEWWKKLRKKKHFLSVLSFLKHLLFIQLRLYATNKQSIKQLKPGTVTRSHCWVLMVTVVIWIRMAPRTGMLECLVPSLWNCLGRVRRCGLPGRGEPPGELRAFTSPCHSQCSLSLCRLLSDHEVSSQLLLPPCLCCGIMDSNPFFPTLPFDSHQHNSYPTSNYPGFWHREHLINEDILE